ncbi:MAG: thiol methyltransferase, partial [Cyanobacteria bacterium J06632_22]
IIHPTRKNREKLKKYQLKVRIDTWKVSIWILELLLLRLLDYQGTYHNRLIHQYVGEIEEVPWA